MPALSDRHLCLINFFISCITLSILEPDTILEWTEVHVFGLLVPSSGSNGCCSTCSRVLRASISTGAVHVSPAKLEMLLLSSNPISICILEVPSSPRRPSPYLRLGFCRSVASIPAQPSTPMRFSLDIFPSGNHTSFSERTSWENNAPVKYSHGIGESTRVAFDNLFAYLFCTPTSRLSSPSTLLPTR